ncbi:MAG: hypothetical protein IPP66_20945 [Anaerolineales bacterium]|nr:hypothetical protein [Anaerolineales bacterium]
MKIDKKIFLCVLLLLCSCTESLPTPQEDPALATQEYFEKKSEQHTSEFLSAFEFNERCKPACWFGVEPGVTTIDDAVALLAGNGKSGVRLSEIADQEIQAEWYVGKDRFLMRVYIKAETNVVKSITLQQMCCIRVKYFIDLLGTPDGASADIHQAPGLTVTNYFVYYLEKKTALNIMDYDLQGLDQDAFIEAIFLADEFSVENIQPWIGYGYLKEYLPGQKLPIGLSLTP